MSNLTVTEFNKVYYDEHKKAGLDYLGHGYWQESYAQMICECTFQKTYVEPVFLDLGCACGSILNGFKKQGIFKKTIGIDVNTYMVELGKKHFGFADDEILSASATHIPVPSNSVTLVHSAQVFEHIPEEHMEDIIKEMKRVMTSDARAVIALDAVRQDETPEQYMGDPTHVTLKSPAFWTNLFYRHGLIFDIEAYDRYARSHFGPTKNVPDSFFEAYRWSLWTLRNAE